MHLYVQRKSVVPMSITKGSEPTHSFNTLADLGHSPTWNQW